MLDEKRLEEIAALKAENVRLKEQLEAAMVKDCMSCYNDDCQEYRNKTAGGCPRWRGLQEEHCEAD